MSIDTGSTTSYNASFPVAGINQSSKTFRDNFSIIKTAIERLQAASHSANSIFSINASQTGDGHIQYVLSFKDNMFAIPVGDPTVAPTVGAMRMNTGVVQYYNGSTWKSLLSATSGDIGVALGFTPAPIASPTFTGIPSAPTAAAGTNTTQLATTAFVKTAINNIIGSAPGALDSLSELAQALNNDPNFATTIVNGLAGKAAIDHTHGDLIGTITADSGVSAGNDLTVTGSGGISTSISGSTLTIALNSSAAHGNLSGGNYHALAVANGAAGFMSGADKAKLDSFTGNGFSFARMVVENDQGLHVRDATTPNDSFLFTSDGPVTLSSTGNEIVFGFSMTDGDHGIRAGGDLHALAAPNGQAGFMSGSDKAKLDLMTSANATASVRGYMSPTDKAKLDAMSVSNDGGYATYTINGTTFEISGNSNLNVAGINGMFVDYHPDSNTMYFVLRDIAGVPIDEFLTLQDNFNSSNDRNSSTIPDPIIPSDGTAVDHTLLANGSANISFEWTWPGPDSLFDYIDADGDPANNKPGEDTIDGFQVYVYRSSAASTYTMGTTPSAEVVYALPAYKRSFILLGVAPNDFYTFAVRAYRRVDGDVAPNGLITSNIVHCSHLSEKPYRPSVNVAFAGDITGTIDGHSAATVASNAVDAWGRFSGAGNTLPAGNVEFGFAGSDTQGGDAYNVQFVGSQSAASVQNATINFNSRNDRNGSAINSCVIATNGTAVDHKVNTDGSVDISFEWGWTGLEADIDGFIVYVRASATSEVYVLGTAASQETVYYLTPDRRAFIYAGVAADQYYTFYVQPYRIVDADIHSSGFIRPAAVKPSIALENPYRPMANVAFAGNITGTLDGTSVATVVSSATNAWGRFSGAGNTLPAGNVEFNFAGSDSQGGFATNVLNVGSRTATQVSTAVLNFDSRNDRNGAAIPAPVINGAGEAVDHALNQDGSANISFEWTWPGNNADIDGFIVTVRSSYTPGAYTFGTSPAEESINYVTPDRRAVILSGVPANAYYTFFVEAYRIVDQDINAAGFILSPRVKPTLAAENPYQPSTSVAFGGNVTGTINGVSAATVQTSAQNAWSKFTGVGNTLPAGNVEFNFAGSGSRGGNALNVDHVGTQDASTVQEAVINFNDRNDRDSTPLVNPVILADGTAIDHTLRSNGSADISFEWTWGGTNADIDGFIVYAYASTSSTPYAFGTDASREMVQYVTPEKRAFVLYGVTPDAYYTFGVQAYRIVDQDINATGAMLSLIKKSTRTEENPYRPATAPVFSGDITGTINGTSASAIVSDVNDLVTQVATIDSGSAFFSMAKNPLFSNWPAGQSYPTYWGAAKYGTITNVPGLFSSNAARIDGAAGAVAYISQDIGNATTKVINNNQWIVMDVSVRLVSGTFEGAGVFFWIRDASDTNLIAKKVTFTTDPDSTGEVVGNGVVGETYTFTKLVQINHASAHHIRLFAGAHRSEFGSISNANQIDFLRVGIRPATEGEIEARAASITTDALSATVTTYSGAIATLEGKTEAYLGFGTSAGDFAEAFVQLNAESSPGVNTSSIALGAQEIHLYNTGADTYTRALSVVNGQVEFFGGLSATSYIRLGNGTQWDVALRPKDFSVSDGDVVTFGVDLGTVPTIQWHMNNLSPLGTGEQYWVYPDNLTPTGFTARVKKRVPSTPTTYLLNTDTVSATGPTRQIDKAANPDSPDGTYKLVIAGTITDKPQPIYNTDPYCVVVDAYLHSGQLAGSARVGSPLTLLSHEDYHSYYIGAVSAISFNTVECVKIVTESGIELTVSKSTPITLSDGSVVWVMDSLGCDVPVIDGGEFRYEKIVDLVESGLHRVALISADNGTYAAGNDPQRMIFTHNTYYKEPNNL